MAGAVGRRALHRGRLAADPGRARPL